MLSFSDLIPYLLLNKREKHNWYKKSHQLPRTSVVMDLGGKATTGLH